MKTGRQVNRVTSENSDFTTRFVLCPEFVLSGGCSSSFTSMFQDVVASLLLVVVAPSPPHPQSGSGTFITQQMFLTNRHTFQTKNVFTQIYFRRNHMNEKYSL